MRIALAAAQRLPRAGALSKNSAVVFAPVAGAPARPAGRRAAPPGRSGWLRQLPAGALLAFGLLTAGLLTVGLLAGPAAAGNLIPFTPGSAPCNGACSYEWAIEETGAPTGEPERLVVPAGMISRWMSYARDGKPLADTRSLQLVTDEPGEGYWFTRNGERLLMVKLDACQNWAVMAPAPVTIDPEDAGVMLPGPGRLASRPATAPLALGGGGGGGGGGPTFFATGFPFGGSGGRPPGEVTVTPPPPPPPPSPVPLPLSGGLLLAGLAALAGTGAAAGRKGARKAG